jgi:hypothetical protein
MNIIKVSQPTKDQIIHGLERTLAVFLVASVAFLRSTNGQIGKAELISAGLAGLVAVYQTLLSSTTTL